MRFNLGPHRDLGPVPDRVAKRVGRPRAVAPSEDVNCIIPCPHPSVRCTALPGPYSHGSSFGLISIAGASPRLLLMLYCSGISQCWQHHHARRHITSTGPGVVSAANLGQTEACMNKMRRPLWGDVRAVRVKAGMWRWVAVRSGA